MAIINSSGAILAKARAMYGKRLTLQDYNSLLRMQSISEVASFLKSHPGYGDIMEEVNEALIHRGQLENLLRKALFEKYYRLSSFSFSSGDSIYQLMVSRYEIKQVMACIRLLSAGRMEEYITSVPPYLQGHTSLDLMQIAKVRSMADLRQALAGTPYLAYLNTGADVPDYTMVETRLREAYYARLTKLAGKHGGKLKELVYTQAELFNITTIYRMKFLFRMERVTILSYLLPYRSKLSQAAFKKLLWAEREEDFIQLLKHSGYRRLMENTGFVSPEDFTRRCEEQLCRRILHFSPDTEAVLLAFLQLSEIEADNLTAIIEGIRYEIPADQIRPLLILPQ